MAIASRARSMTTAAAVGIAPFQSGIGGDKTVRDAARIAAGAVNVLDRCSHALDHRSMIESETYWIHLATTAVEIVGTAIIVIGAFGALGAFLLSMARHSAPRADLVAAFRSDLGRSILLGLEFLVAADIINTVAIAPTVRSLIVLAGIVLIRTFLSFSLEVEIDGRWPWQKTRSPGNAPVV